jgi:type I restriction enzyme S subunit
LNSEYFKDHIETYKTGTTFFGITQEAVGFFEMLLPPIEEQQAVIEFIDLENTKIDQAISKILKQIDLLKEYRQTLISNVVTGKVKVC